jgi:hypothetical protein
MNKLFLLAGFFISWVLPLTIHAFFSDWLQVPFPSRDVKQWLPYEISNTLALFVASGWLLKRLHKAFSERNIIVSLSLLWLLLCTINETLRGWFMNAYCTGGTLKETVFFGVLAAADPAFYVVLVGLLPLLNIRSRIRGQYLLTLLASTATLVFIIKPLIIVAQNTILQSLAGFAPSSGWCHQPYGINVLGPAYISFFEPTLAALICIVIAFRSLGQSLMIKVLSGILLIMTLRQQLFAALLYGFYSSDPFWQASISMLQFTLEAAALGLVCSLTWEFSRQDKVN